MGWRVYGEEKPRESPVIEFLIGFFLGAVGFPTQIGWVFTYLGWLTIGVVFATGGGMGLLIGGHFAYASWRRIKKQKK